MAQFTDSYLVLVNMGGTNGADVDNMVKKRVLLVDSDGDAKWLIKDVNDAWIENYKNRIKSDIHKFSNTPDMSDETFGNNLSGVSLRYKLLGMEQLRSSKERKFKKGLQRRIELICNFLSITNKELTYTGIDMQFNNTLPQNILETSQIIQNLSNYLSVETLIEQLPFVENAKEEIEKKKSEDAELVDIDYNKLKELLPGEKADGIAFIVDALKIHKENELLKKKRLKIYTSIENSYVFTNQEFNHTHEAKLRLYWQRFCKNHGIRYVPPYGLRHTTATLLAFNNVPAPNISKQLGHTNSATTQIYIHAAEEVQTEIDEILTSTISPKLYVIN